MECMIAPPPSRTPAQRQRHKARSWSGLRGTGFARWLAFALALLGAPFAHAVDEYYKFSTVVFTDLVGNGYTEMLTPTNSGWIKNTTFYYGEYPSTHHNMQFIAFRNPTSNAILYVQTHDPEGRYVQWEVNQPSGASTFQLVLTTWDKVGFPSGFYSIDTSMTATTQTEFYRKVARKYKQWAIQQKWAERKFSPMDKASAMINVQNLLDDTRAQVSNYLIDWVGQDTLCYVTYWRKYWQWDLDGAVPDYRISGNDAPGSSFTTLQAQQNVQKLDQLLNCKPFGYTNPLLWDSRVASHPGAPASTVDGDMNEVYTNVVDARYSTGPMVKKNSAGDVLDYANPDRKFICQAQQSWRDLFVGKMVTMAEDHHFQGIYADQIAFEAPKLCHDTAHGHDVADPWAWQNGLRDLLAELKSQTGMMVFTEGSAEIYMDLVDAYLMWEDTGKADTTNLKQVPLFREVYGEFARWIGWQIDVPAHEDVDCDPEETCPPTLMPDPTPLLAAIRKADNFGYLYHGQPYMLATSTNEKPRLKMTPKSGGADRYQDVREAIAAAPYKTVYERGGGAVNWIEQDTVNAAPANVMDSETGTAAISLDSGSGGSYRLPIDEKQKFQLSWDMKMDEVGWIMVEVKANERSESIQLLYDQTARTHHEGDVNGGWFGLGANSADNHWRSFQRNLAADLQSLSSTEYPTLTLDKVLSVSVFGTGLIDNIAFSNTPALVVEDGADAGDWTATCYNPSTCSLTGLSASSVADADTGANVIRFSGITHRDHGEGFVRTINDSLNFEASWDLKTPHAYYVSFFVEADDGLVYNLLYDQSARDFRQTVGTTVKLGLGADTTDGDWHTFRRNLADDLFEGTGKSIVSVVSVRAITTGSDGAISNVKLWGNGLRSSGY